MAQETLSRSLARKIMVEIEKNDLKPGDKLPSEGELGKNLDASRIAIREAIKFLEGRGVIETLSGRGALVRAPDSDLMRLFFSRSLHTSQTALADLMELRAGIEVFSVGLAATRRSPSEASRITEICREMGRHISDLEVYADLDVTFHLAIAEASRNEALVIVMSSIREAMKSSVMKVLKARKEITDLSNAQSFHVEIAAAIQANDSILAADAMTRHFTNATKTMANFND